MDYELTKVQKALRDFIINYYRERGIKPEIICCPLRDCDDIPKYLKRLEEQQEYQRKHPSKIKFRGLEAIAA